MLTLSKKICCGETELCNECLLLKTNSGVQNNTVKSHTLNALGRCDMYSGPARVVFDTSK